MKLLSTLLLMLTGLAACGDGGSTGSANHATPAATVQGCLDTTEGLPALKAVFPAGVQTGVAIKDHWLDDPGHPAWSLVADQFDMWTAENAFKWKHENQTDYAARRASFIKQQQQTATSYVLHTLYWSNGDKVANDVTTAQDRQSLIQRMTARAVQLRNELGIDPNAAPDPGGPTVYIDVLNEAFDEKGQYRPTRYHELLEDKLFAEAFKIAHEHFGNNAVLIYNDFELLEAGKRKAVINAVRALQEEHGISAVVAEQAHYNMSYPSKERLVEMLDDFRAAGVPIHISEFDIDPLPKKVSVSPCGNGEPCEVACTSLEQAGCNPYADAPNLPAEAAEAHGQRYYEVLSTFLDPAYRIGRISFWNLSDEKNSANHFPVKGRTSFPALFDRTLKPKPAFCGVVRAAREATAKQ